ncbi:MAG: TraR/DksA C4-type zinc finger protein [Patescibacteria group bacterium]
MSLTKEETKKYEQRLEQEREKLLREIQDHEKAVDLGNDIDSEEEEADEAEETGNQLAISRALRDRLNEIDEALESARDGRYGLCKNCGKDISKEVLNVVPESRLCKACKQKGL